MVRHKLVEDIEEVNFEKIRLKQLFSLTVDDAISFLASVGALKNKMNCDKCTVCLFVKFNCKKENIRGIKV